MIKIALVLPTYNNDDLTIKCLQSINQNALFEQSIQIIWVDNNSDYNNRKNVLQCLRSLDNITYKNIFLKQNCGFIKATNIGLKFALDLDYDYIGIINNDIIVSKNWLKNLYDGFKVNKKIMCIGSIQYTSTFQNINNIYDFNQLQTVASGSFEQVCNQILNFKNNYKIYNIQDFNNFTNACIPYYSVLFKPEIFKKIGLLSQTFNFGYSDDTQFNFRIISSGYLIAKSLTSVVFHDSRSTFKKVFDYNFIQTIQIGNAQQLRISKTLNSQKKKKYVIYTAIIDNYDNLPMYQNFDTQNFDYVCFTNSEKILTSTCQPWIVIDIKDITDSLNIQDHIKWARYFKTHPHLFFENYQKSIWVDANILFFGNHLEYLQKLDQNNFILIPQHPKRSNIYQEIQICKLCQKDSEQNLNNIREFLLNEGYSLSDQNLVQSNVIVRRHLNKKCIFLMEKWWDMIKTYSRRDQLSFNFIFWKYNENYLSIPWNILNKTYFTTNYKHLGNQ